MAKVFLTVDDHTVYFISNSTRRYAGASDSQPLMRNQVIGIKLTEKAFYERQIVFPVPDLFQIAYNGQGDIVGVGEESGILAYVKAEGSPSSKLQTVQLTEGYIYRTVDAEAGLVVVNGIKKLEDQTENIQLIMNREKQIIASNKIFFEGSHLGKYIHKMKLVVSSDSSIPVIGMISNHYEYPNFYLFALSPDLKLVEVFKKAPLVASSKFIL